jgi:hypothetical protein
MYRKGRAPTPKCSTILQGIKVPVPGVTENRYLANTERWGWLCEGRNNLVHVLQGCIVTLSRFLFSPQKQIEKIYRYQI